MIKRVLTLIYSQLFCCLVSHYKYSDIYFEKNSFKFIFISVLYIIVINMSATYQNLRSKCIEIKHFAFMCTICTRVQINLQHLAPPRELEQVQTCTRVQILKTPFTWPKIHPGCKYAPGANCTHERVFRNWD